MSIRNRFFVTIAGFLALGFNGFTFTFMGSSLPAIQSYLDIGISRTGILMAFFQAGVTVFSLIAGILSDHFRHERIMAVGCLLLGCAVLLFCTTNWFPMNSAIVLFMGAGIGINLSGSNTLMAGLYPQMKASILNFHHVFFGLGSFLGPLVLGLLVSWGSNWRIGFAGEAAALFVLGLVFILSRGDAPRRGRGSAIQKQLGPLLKNRCFLTIMIVTTMAMGAQVTIMLMGVTFLTQAKQCTLAAAGSTISFFAVFLMAGRVICSRLSVLVKPTSIILALLWLQTLFLVLAWLGDAWLAIVALAFSGFAFSGVYPTALTLAGNLFPEVEGSVLGILSTMGGLGSAFFCWQTGYVAGLVGMKNSFSVIVLAVVVALIIFQTQFGRMSREKLRSAGGSGK